MRRVREGEESGLRIQFWLRIQEGGLALGCLETVVVVSARMMGYRNEFLCPLRDLL